MKMSPELLFQMLRLDCTIWGHKSCQTTTKCKTVYKMQFREILSSIHKDIVLENNDNNIVSSKYTSSVIFSKCASLEATDAPNRPKEQPTHMMQ